MSQFTSAVYSLHKKPESFVHSVFCGKLLGNYPETLQKTWIEKPTSGVGFLKTLPVFQFFFFFCQCTCKHLLQSCWYYSGFGLVVRDLLRNHPTTQRLVRLTGRLIRTVMSMGYTIRKWACDADYNVSSFLCIIWILLNGFLLNSVHMICT